MLSVPQVCGATPAPLELEELRFITARVVSEIRIEIRRTHVIVHAELPILHRLEKMTMFRLAD